MLFDRYYELVFDFNKLLVVFEDFCDANWVTDNDEVSSTSCYVFTFDPGTTSWKFSKQTFIERYTMESELISVELAGHEAKWLRNLLTNIPLWGREASQITIHSTMLLTNTNSNCQKSCVKWKKETYLNQTR